MKLVLHFFVNIFFQYSLVEEFII